MTFLLGKPYDYNSKSSLFDYLFHSYLELTQKLTDKDGTKTTTQRNTSPIRKSNNIYNYHHYNKNNENQLTKPFIWSDDYKNKSANQLYSSFHSEEMKKLSSSNAKGELFKIVYTTKGIINLGNTCYINSILQILIHCPPFIQQFLSINDKTIQSQDIAYSFYLLIKAIISSGQYEDNQIIEFYNCFLAYNPLFLESTQQDASHFLLAFLQKLNSELNEVPTSNQVSELNSKGNNKKELFINFISFCLNKERSIVTKVFVWNISTTYICQNCTLTFYSFNQIIDLPLAFDAFEMKLNSTSIIKEYFSKKQWNELQTDCTHCKQRTLFKHITSICSLPQVLIFSLQRGNIHSLNIKNNNSISFDLVLDMKELIDEELFDYSNTNTKYTLFATLHHEGDLNKGHYYSMIRIKNQWFKFQDSQVTSFNNEMLHLETVLSIYYLRTDEISS